MSAVEVEIKPAPDRLKFGEQWYVRADLFELMEWQAKLNRETCEAQANVIRRLCARLEAMGVRPE